MRDAKTIAVAATATKNTMRAQTAAEAVAEAAVKAQVVNKVSTGAAVRNAALILGKVPEAAAPAEVKEAAMIAVATVAAVRDETNEDIVKAVAETVEATVTAGARSVPKAIRKVKPVTRVIAVMIAIVKARAAAEAVVKATAASKGETVRAKKFATKKKAFKLKTSLMILNEKSNRFPSLKQKRMIYPWKRKVATQFSLVKVKLQVHQCCTG